MMADTTSTCSGNAYAGAKGSTENHLRYSHWRRVQRGHMALMWCTLLADAPCAHLQSGTPLVPRCWFAALKSLSEPTTNHLYVGALSKYACKVTKMQGRQTGKVALPFPDSVFWEAC